MSTFTNELPLSTRGGTITTIIQKLETDSQTSLGTTLTTTESIGANKAPQVFLDKFLNHYMDNSHGILTNVLDSPRSSTLLMVLKSIVLSRVSLPPTLFEGSTGIAITSYNGDSAATFLVALKAITLILSVPNILASPISSEIKRGKIDPNIFLGAQITSIQRHFTQHKVTLIKTIGGNDEQDIALAYGKYEDSAAFIKCLTQQPFKGSAFDREAEIDRERKAFSILQEADARPGSNKLIGYTNVSRAYTHFEYG
ncbi:hypothetical protein BDF22DRAFT_773476 [Syncephalis plumigaleata]|nr:hypothetical protein BDF22DRAFT_773476 [Syncephalis plumigaleata]